MEKLRLTWPNLFKVTQMISIKWEKQGGKGSEVCPPNEWTILLLSKDRELLVKKKIFKLSNKAQMKQNLKCIFQIKRCRR